MRINGSNLDIMFVKKVPLNTKIILISYFFDEKSGTEYIYQEKELYSLKESLLKDIFNYQIDKLNHLIKCFSYNNNLTIIELNLSEDYKKIKMKKTKENIQINNDKDKTINKIKATFSNNNNFICLSAEDLSICCFINDDNNMKFDVIPFTNQRKCQDIKVYYFENYDEYCFSCQIQKEVILSVIRKINKTSEIYYREKKFLIQNEKDYYTVIYSKSNNDYTIISSSNFTDSKNALRNLDMFDDPDTDDVESNSFDKSDSKIETHSTFPNEATFQKRTDVITTSYLSTDSTLISDKETSSKQTNIDNSLSSGLMSESESSNNNEKETNTPTNSEINVVIMIILAYNSY